MAYSIPSTAISPKAIAAVIVIAVMAGVVPALQPMLLGGLLKLGRLTSTSLGYAATAESLGMAVASTFATFALRPRHMRSITTIALLTAIIANASTMIAHDEAIVAVRAISGLANGLLLWVLVCMMTRAAQPTRVFAFYITGQAVAAFLLSSVFAATVLPSIGVGGAYATLLGLNALVLALVPLTPRSYADSVRTGTAVPSATGWIGLIGVAAQIGAIMAFWVYIVPLAQQAGFSADIANRMIGIANGAQIVAGLAACALAARLPAVPVVIGTAVASMAAIFCTGVSASAALWTAGLMLFAFCWMFAPPFHIAYLLRADPSGRAPMLVSPAQLLGMALGPMAAASLIGQTGVDQARGVAIGAFALTIACAAIVAIASRGFPRSASGAT